MRCAESFEIPYKDEGSPNISDEEA